jgi:molybdenum cofactor cytidylyltransferase
LIFGAQPIEACEGALLAHSLVVGGVRWAKGRRLGSADIDAARSAGLTTLTVARLEPGDVPEDEAAARLGAALAGPGLVAHAPVHGRVNLSATSPGLLQLDPAAVAALNAVDERLTLGTLAPGTHVATGIVATIKIIPYAVPADILAAALAEVSPLSLASFRPLTVRLIQTRLPGTSDKLLAKTERVTADRLATLGAELLSVETCAHEPAGLADRLRTANEDLLLVAGASATVDRRDTVPSAIERAGGTVERLGMPVDPGNLLCLGRIGGRVVLGLPGCARSPKRNGLDLVLERLAAGLPLASADIAAMGVGGLLPDLGDRPEPRQTVGTPDTKVGVLILAAGRSSRMGSQNKLLADLRGRPLVAHVAAAAEAAGLPALLVTGHLADAVRAAAGPYPVAVHAPDFAQGLSRSLRAGLVAVPADWSAAIVCLGDMPGVPAPVLKSLASAHSAPGDVIVPTWGGKRGNPVLWGRAHFTRLSALEGDVGGKALFPELAAQVREMAVDTDAILADIDTPEALAAARR